MEAHPDLAGFIAVRKGKKKGKRKEKGKVEKDRGCPSVDNDDLPGAEGKKGREGEERRKDRSIAAKSGGVLMYRIGHFPLSFNRNV